LVPPELCRDGTLGESREALRENAGELGGKGRPRTGGKSMHQGMSSKTSAILPEEAGVQGWESKK